MRQFLSATILSVSLLGFAGVSHADKLFDPAAPADWSKVQDGKVQQWTRHLREGDTLVRVDVVWSDEAPVSYLIRRQCPEGSRHPFGFASFKPGNMLGIGLDCDGRMISDRSIHRLLSQAGEFPSEVVAAINQ